MELAGRNEKRSGLLVDARGLLRILRLQPVGSQQRGLLVLVVVVVVVAT